PGLGARRGPGAARPVADHRPPADPRPTRVPGGVRDRGARLESADAGERAVKRRLGLVLTTLAGAAPLAAQTSAPQFDSTRLAAVVEYLRTQVDSAFPGAVVAVGNHDHVALLAPVGPSGADAARPLFRETETREAALALVDTTPLDTVPGARYLYSDLGAIVLTQVVERITKTRIDQYLGTAVFKPLGMTTTRYLPPAEWRDRIAP